MRRATLAVAALLTAACERGCQDPFAQQRSEWLLADLNTQQILQRPDKTRERVVYDRDQDGRAEAQMLYDERGRPLRLEADLDDDGDVDIWQYLDEDGRVVKTGASLRDTGRPDEWRYTNPLGELVMRDLDRDGDGEPDWREIYFLGRLVEQGRPAD